MWKRGECAKENPKTVKQKHCIGLILADRALMPIVTSDGGIKVYLCFLYLPCQLVAFEEVLTRTTQCL